MFCATRVIRVIDDARDAGINAAKRCDQVAGVYVLWAIVEPKELMCSPHVVGQRSGIRNNAAKLAFPRMPVTIYEARENDCVRRVNDASNTIVFPGFID